MKGADWMSQLAAGRSSWGRELTHSIHSVFGGGDKVKDKDKDKDKLKDKVKDKDKAAGEGSSPIQ